MYIAAMLDMGKTHQHCKTFINMDLEADLGQSPGSLPCSLKASVLIFAKLFCGIYSPSVSNFI